MLRIFAALVVCYFAGTAAGRGFLPYSVGLPANAFKNDIDTIATTSAKLASPENLKDAATSMTLDASRRFTGSMGIRH